MYKVTLVTSWERSDQEVSLFELAECCFSLGSHGQQQVLPAGHECSLAIVGYNRNAIPSPESFAHGAGSVAAAKCCYCAIYSNKQLYDMLFLYCAHFGSPACLHKQQRTRALYLFRFRDSGLSGLPSDTE